MLTQARLKELFEYREDGWLIRKVTVSNQKIGTKLGHVGTKGYVECCIDYIRYSGHHLVYLYHNGYIPELLDHINHIPHDNRIENLREASYAENGANRLLGSNNTSGVKGLIYNKAKAYWEARVNVAGKRYTKVFVGREQDLLARAKATEWLYATRQQLHGEFTNHG